jgi:16S rRNA (cytosine967-C5)-methyltransferase
MKGVQHEGRRALSGSSVGLAARQVALEILMAVERRGSYADAMLGTRVPAFPPPDRRLATRLVLGTIAWRARLDYELGHFCGRDLAQIQAEALTIMRMGLLQIRFLDRIAPHAAVSTSVELAKRSHEARVAAGFVNAVLRRATREKVALPVRSDDEVGWLAIAFSHPRWMVERFIDWYGREAAEALMAANNQAAPNVVRLNLARATREQIVRRLQADGMEVEATGRFPETATLESAVRFDSPTYRGGLFQAQSEASQLVARLLAPPHGGAVVDCTAAPGGKAAHLAELVGADGSVTAVDRNFAGLKNARRLCRQLRHRNVQFVQADTSSPLPLARGFDCVLLDAPCTGLGTLRAHPEIRWRLKPGDPARMAVLQSRMLTNAAALVRPGGAIVYSVCSLAPEEGENVVRAFLDTHPIFALDLHAFGRDAFKGLLDTQGMMRTRPDLGGLDGFFAARLIRAALF